MTELTDYLAADHQRLDRLLERALDDPAAYQEFRGGLLRHIGIEERILFPDIRRKHGGDTPLLEQLHRDHAAISALLVPPPTEWEIAQLRAILLEHNPLEECEGGLYDQVDPALVTAARAYPEVRLAKHADSPLLRETIETLLRQRKR